eukprot:jgi/Astpho2/4632/fgenesh1_pg.00067_%23_144_t
MTWWSDRGLLPCRLVCKRWRLGFSLAVHSLCMKQSVWAKQWPAISTAFPLCRRLDIRNLQILPEHVPILAQLSSVQVLQHSDFQCPGSPEVYIAQLTAWTSALLEQAPHMRVLAEVHTFSPGQVLTDMDAQQLVALPTNQLLQLFFSDNGQGCPEGFTVAGLDHLLRDIPALASVNFRGCKYLKMADRARVHSNLHTDRLRRISLLSLT